MIILHKGRRQVVGMTETFFSRLAAPTEHPDDRLATLVEGDLGGALSAPGAVAGAPL